MAAEREQKKASQSETGVILLPEWIEMPDIDLYMDQLLSLISRYLNWIPEQHEKELTAAMVNNYVKQGIIPSPVKKKYNRCHISALLILCMLKSILPLPEIKKLLRPKADSQETAAALYRQFKTMTEDTFHKNWLKLKEFPETEAISEARILQSALTARSEQIVCLSLISQIGGKSENETEE